MDENSDRARCVAGKCRGVEVRDIDVHRLDEMPATMKGVPTLVEGDEMLMGSDCLAALVDMMGEAPPPQMQQPQMQPQQMQQAQPRLEERGTGSLSASDVQQQLNAYRNSMNAGGGNI